MIAQAMVPGLTRSRGLTTAGELATPNNGDRATVAAKILTMTIED